MATFAKCRRSRNFPSCLTTQDSRLLFFHFARNVAVNLAVVRNMRSEIDFNVDEYTVWTVYCSPVVRIYAPQARRSPARVLLSPALVHSRTFARKKLQIHPLTRSDLSGITHCRR